MHGGLHDHELQTLGLHRTPLVDFSVNINPYGPHRAVVRAVRAAALETYPDPTALATRQVLGAHLGVDSDALALGHGAADLMWHAARLLSPQGPALVVEPTFTEYAAAMRATGGTVVALSFTNGSVPDIRSPDGACYRPYPHPPSLDAIATAAHQARATSIWLCSPNNPTGTRIPATEVAAWAAGQPWTLVLDQSFVSLSTHPEDSAVAMPPNVICLRSLTKDHALAGLRVGYLIAAPQFVQRFERTRAPWSCGTPAQAAIRAACAHPEFVERCRRRLLQDRDALRCVLKERFGLRGSDGAVPFFLTEVPNAAQLRADLLQRWHILVRDCGSFGLPNVVRLAARPAPDRARLVQALAESLVLQ